MRQAWVTAGAAALLAGLCGLIVAGGGALKTRGPAVAGASSESTSAVEAAPEGVAAPDAEGAAVGSRRLRGEAPGVDGKPAVDGELPLERVAPRGALSELGQALPPRPKPPGEWKGTRLPQPVATAAGLVEAKGYRVAVAGIDPLPAGEMCDYQGRDWPCGVRARAAFRAFLRGRAITCVVPPEAEPEIITAACMVGKQDVAAWLASNGWAPARADGDYAALGDAARAAGKGIYGPPPPTDAPSSIVSASELPPPPDSGGSILAAPPAQDAAGTAAPVIAPGQVFPQPPAPPTAPAQ